MPPTFHRAELYVGLFVLLGAALVAGLVLRFSRPHLATAGGYPITVEVKDATGIRAGVPVRLGGVEIGRVANDPILNEDFVLLSIALEIFPGNRIPVGATVKVGTSGLMGDSFVRIIPPDRPTGEFLPEGHRIVAESGASLNDLAGEAGEAFDGLTEASVEIREAADRIERFTTKLDEGVFTEANIDNLRVLLSEMRASSESLRTASDRINPLLDETGTAISGVADAAAAAKASFGVIEEGMQKFTGTLGTVDPLLTEVDGTLEDLRKTLASADSLFKEFESGDGLATALLKDPALRKDWTEFLDKVNRVGLLFYPRDGAEDEGSGVSGEEKPLFPGLRRQP